MKFFRVGCVYIWHPVSSQWFILGMNDIPDDEIAHIMHMDMFGRRECLDAYANDDASTFHYDLENRTLTGPARVYHWNLFRLFASVNYEYIRREFSVGFVESPCPAFPGLYALHGNVHGNRGMIVCRIVFDLNGAEWVWRVRSLVILDEGQMRYRYFFRYLNACVSFMDPQYRINFVQLYQSANNQLSVICNELAILLQRLEGRQSSINVLPLFKGTVKTLVRISDELWPRLIKLVFDMVQRMSGFRILPGPPQGPSRRTSGLPLYSLYYYVRVNVEERPMYFRVCVVTEFRPDRGGCGFDVYDDDQRVFDSLAPH